MLREFDDLIDEDSYETPKEIFLRMALNYNLYFELDAAANSLNTQCAHWLEDALHEEWAYGL